MTGSTFRMAMARWCSVCVGLAVLAAIPLYAQAPSGTLPPGVVAAQGGAQVTLQDIDAYAEKIPAKDRGGFFDSPKRIEGVIMNLLLQKQLAAEARSNHLDQDSLVEREILQSTDDTLARVDVEHYRKSLVEPNFKDLAQEYYTSHKDEFVVPGEVDVEHVLVSDKERGDEAAKKLIKEVEAAAHAHPDEFKALVEKYSDDPSKKDNHGLIKDATSDKLTPPFAKAAKALKKRGEISPIVKTKFGYHVLKLVARTPSRQESFEEIRDGLMQKLRDEWVEQRVAQHTGDMRGNPLNVSPDLVASLRTRFLPPGAITPEEAQKAADELAAKKAAVAQGAEENKH